MSAFHIPQNERARASDLSIRKANKPSFSSKIAKKSLNAAFMSLSEYDSKDRVDFSPISEVELKRQVAENLMLVTDEEDLSESSPETLLFSDRSPSNSVITIEKDQAFKAVDEDSKLHSLEAEILVRFLRKAKTQLKNLPSMDAGSKKLLDSLIKMALEDLHGGVPDERSLFVHLLGVKKTRITFWCFLLCVLAITAILLFSSGNQRSFIGPLPT